MNVKVKELDWKLEEENWWCSIPPISNGWGYEVRITNNGNVRVRAGSQPFEDFEGSADEAKAACFKDYEALVLSAVE